MKENEIFSHVPKKDDPQYPLGRPVIGIHPCPNCGAYDFHISECKYIWKRKNEPNTQEP